MGRFKRRFHGRNQNQNQGQNKQFGGPRHVRPNRPHFRNFRERPPQQPQQQQQGAPEKPAEIPVHQARGPGHLRIMGKIEYDIRILLKIVGVEPDKTIMYLACAREMYSDLENTKADKAQAALDNTTARWLARGFDEEMVQRIRTKVNETYNSFKAVKPPKPPVVEEVVIDANEPGL